MVIKNKRAQEEIVGFAIIVIIVSLIIVFFLVFSLSNRDQAIEGYKEASFLQSTLQYTSSCENRADFLSVQELVASCYNKEQCGEEEACVALNQTLKGILEASWPSGSELPVKGYKMEAVSGEELVFSLSSGNVTGSYRGAQQIIPESGASIKVYFTAYY